jgi:uncharacterized phage protein (TIGR01671 family)
MAAEIKRGNEMREIKFRAWFDGHMCEVAKLDFWGDPDQATCDMARMSLTEYGNVEEIFDVYLNEVELMQCTGLKDRNGKEIYEGDIVLCKIHDKEYMGLVEYTNTYGFYYLSGMGRSDTELWGCNEKKVLGNIYDNPELMV